MFKKIKLFLTLGFIFLLISFFVFPQTASADALSALSDTMSRLADSTPSAVYSDHTIRYTTPSGVQAAEDMTITMPSGFTIGTVDDTDIDVSWGATTGYENELTLAATCTGATWGAAFAGQVLTITSCTGTITATNKVVVEIGNNASGGNAQIQNHATAATYTISIAGSFGDTGKMAIVILTNDQVQATATIDPTITLTISANLTEFGILSTSSIITSSPNITLTITTNAGSGFTLSTQDEGDSANPGLYSSLANDIVGSADAVYVDEATLAINTEGYGIQGATTGSGSGQTVTIASRYDKSGNNVGGFERTATTLATASGSVSGREVVVTHKASISGLNKAGAYNDVITYIATGNF